MTADVQHRDPAVVPGSSTRTFLRNIPDAPPGRRAVWLSALADYPVPVPPDVESNGNGRDPMAGFRHVDAAAVLSGDLTPRAPDILERADGNRLLYTRCIHWLQGEPESLKGWLALTAAAECLTAGRPVVYLDWEDNAEAIFGRLVTLGVDRTAIAGLFRYIQPPGAVNSDVLRMFMADELPGVALVVIDACAEAMLGNGLDPESNRDTLAWIQGLPAACADAGAAVVVIDHVTKSREARGRYAIGAQAKLQLTDVTYAVRVVDPLAPGAIGRALITVQKDRLGGIRAFSVDHKRTADFVVDATGPVMVPMLMVPRAFAGRTDRMTAMVEVMRGFTAPQSKTAIVEATPGKDKTNVEALTQLIATGVVVQAGSRGQYPLYALANGGGDDE